MITSRSRRHGKEWYIGTLAGSHSAELSIALDFLGGGKYLAETVSDAPDADLSPTHTVLGTTTVDRSQQLKAILVPGGGQAIHIRPAQ